MKKVIIALIVSVVLALLLGIVILTAHVVAGDERGILLANDAFVRVVEPGLVFLISRSERLERVSISETTINRYPRVTDADQRSAKIHLSVTFHHDPDRAETIYRSYGTDDAYAYNVIGMCSKKRLISPRIDVVSEVVEAAAKSIFARYTASDFEDDKRAHVIHDRDALYSALELAIKEALVEEPIVISAVVVVKIEYDQD